MAVELIIALIPRSVFRKDCALVLLVMDKAVNNKKNVLHLIMAIVLILNFPSARGSYYNINLINMSNLIKKLAATIAQKRHCFTQIRLSFLFPAQRAAQQLLKISRLQHSIPLPVTF